MSEDKGEFMGKLLNIHIRKAQESDIKSIYQFERNYIIEHEPNQLDRWDSAKKHTLEMLRNNIDRMFVASIECDLVGHCYWSLSYGNPCIYSIYISENSRKLGLASKLISKVEEQIRENEYQIVTLSTLVINPAQNVFSKLGYEVTSIEDGWINYKKDLTRNEN